MSNSKHNKYYCEPCDTYILNKSSSIKEHLETKKHKKNANEELKKILCECGKELSNVRSLEDHRESRGHYFSIIKLFFNVHKDIINNIIVFIIPSWNCCNKIYWSLNNLNNHKKTDLHNLSKLEKNEKMKQSYKNSIIKGNSLEEYFVNKLSKYVQDIEQVNDNSTIDIIFKLENETFYRALQCKTLRKDLYSPSCFTFKSSSNYNDDLLILAANIENNIYTYFFYEEIKNKKTVSISINDPLRKIFFSEKKFIKEISTLLDKTRIIDGTEYMYITHRKEYDMINRLKIKLKEIGLKFKKNKADDVIDGKIYNDEYKHNVQLKHSTDIHKNCCAFNFYKQEDKKHIPYSDKDNIDFFIFEIGETYENNFFILPINILIDKGYIKTNDTPGRISIGMPLNSFDITKYKNGWLLEYKNKFELLLGKSIEEDSMFSRLKKTLKNHY